MPKFRLVEFTRSEFADERVIKTGLKQSICLLS